MASGRFLVLDGPKSALRDGNRRFVAHQFVDIDVQTLWQLENSLGFEVQ